LLIQTSFYLSLRGFQGKFILQFTTRTWRRRGTGG